MVEDNIKKIQEFLQLKRYNCSRIEEDEQIKEICVAKLCEILGIECEYNYQNQMFQIFSSILAQAICEKLKIKKTIASDSVRLFKYNGINFVEKAKMFLNSEDVDEAVLDIFNYVDEHKNAIIEN